MRSFNTLMTWMLWVYVSGIFKMLQYDNFLVASLVLLEDSTPLRGDKEPNKSSIVDALIYRPQEDVTNYYLTCIHIEK